VRSLHFAIELRRAGLDVGVPDALVFNIPVEFSLELMAVVSPDFFDPEGEFRVDHWSLDTSSFSRAEIKENVSRVR